VAVSSAAATKLELGHDADVIDMADGGATKVSSGGRFDLRSNGAYQIIAPGRLPLLVVGADAGETLKISAPTPPEAVRDRLSGEVDRKVGDLMVRLNDLQDLVRRKRLEEAEAALGRLRAENPRLGFLDFVEASLLFLRGRREEALALGEKALKALPDYAEGRRFVEQLKGGKTP